MKRIFLHVLPAFVAGVLASCSSMTEIDERISSIESRVDALEANIKKINENVEALKSLVEGGVVSNIEEADGVYTVTFADGHKITLNQGSIGVADAPVVTIDKDGFWMVDYGTGAEYILVDGQKVKAVGTDGVTPKFSTDAEGFWTVSYDGGNTFSQVKDAEGNPVKATPAGEIKDKWFEDVKIDGGKLVVTLKDGSVYSLPVVKDFSCVIKEAEGIVVFTQGETKTFAVESKGVASAMVTAPSGWSAALADEKLSVTAPAATKAIVVADSKTDVCILAISEGGFASISKVRVQLDDTPVIVTPVAEASFVSAEIEKLSFNVSTTDATSWKYICQKATETAPTAEKILAEGVEGTSPLTVEGLEAETEYILYVLPVNNDVLGSVVSATGTTLAVPTPTYTGLYAKYMNGEDVVIAGVTVNKTAYPDANYISASSEDKTLKSGVNFVDADVVAEIPTGGESNINLPFLLVGNTEGQRTEIKAAGQLRLMPLAGRTNVAAIENVKLSTAELGDDSKYFLANMSSAETGGFIDIDKISIKNCGIDIVGDKHFNYMSKDKFMNAIVVEDCDVKVNSKLSPTNFFNNNGATKTMAEFTLRNNVFWSDSEVKGFNLCLNTKAKVSKLTVEHNTFVNVYAAFNNGYCQFAGMIDGMISNNLFYYTDYTKASYNAKNEPTYTGIIKEVTKENEETYKSFTKNYAIYDYDALPTQKLKVGQNTNNGEIFNKTKSQANGEVFDFTEGSDNFDIAKGIFKSKKAEFGAQR